MTDNKTLAQANQLLQFAQKNGGYIGEAVTEPRTVALALEFLKTSKMIEVMPDQLAEDFIGNDTTDKIMYINRITLFGMLVAKMNIVFARQMIATLKAEVQQAKEDKEAINDLQSAKVHTATGDTAHAEAPSGKGDYAAEE